MPTAVNSLRPLKWGSLSAPCSNVQIKSANILAVREWPFVDGVGHQPTGRDSRRVSATLHFLATINPGDFPGKWISFRKTLVDGQARFLQTPDNGTFTARVDGNSYAISAESTAGIIVDVSWTESIVDNTNNPQAGAASPTDAAAAAVQLDGAMARLNMKFQDGTGATSFTTFLAQIATLIALAPQLYIGQINAALGALDQVEDRFDMAGQQALLLPNALKDAALSDPARSLLWLSIGIVRDSLTAQLAQVIAQQRPTKTVKLSTDTSMDALAKQYGQSITDMILLNQSVALTPLVPKGTTISYYADVGNSV